MSLLERCAALPEAQVITQYPCGYGVKNKATITVRQVLRLAPGKEVDDELMLFLLKRADAAKPIDTTRKIFDSFFFKKLRQDGYDKVASNTKSVDIFELDLLLFLVHYAECHWLVAAAFNPAAILSPPSQDVAAWLAHRSLAGSSDMPVDVDHAQNSDAPDDLCTLFTLDSSGGHRQDVVDLITGYLSKEALDKQRVQSTNQLHMQKVDTLKVAGVPQQGNSFDCGLFAAHNVERLLDNPAAFLSYARASSADESSTFDWKEDRIRPSAVLRNRVLQDIESTIPHYIKFRSQGQNWDRRFGLENLGGTCYIAGVAQMLFAMRELRVLLAEGTHHQLMTPDGRASRDGRLVKALRALLNALKMRRVTKADVTAFKHELDRFTDRFADDDHAPMGSKHHDAEELLLAVLNAWKDAANQIPLAERVQRHEEDNGGIEGKQPDDDIVASAAQATWQRTTDEQENSLVRDLFCSQLCSRLQCRHCLMEARSFPTEMMLNLDIPVIVVDCIPRGHQRPRQSLRLCLSAGATFADVRQLLAQQSPLQMRADHMVFIERFDRVIMRVFSDHDRLDLVRKGMQLVCYELFEAHRPDRFGLPAMLEADGDTQMLDYSECAVSPVIPLSLAIVDANGRWHNVGETSLVEVASSQTGRKSVVEAVLTELARFTTASPRFFVGDNIFREDLSYGQQPSLPGSASTIPLERLGALHVHRPETPLNDMDLILQEEWQEWRPYNEAPLPGGVKAGDLFKLVWHAEEWKGYFGGTDEAAVPKPHNRLNDFRHWSQCSIVRDAYEIQPLRLENCVKAYFGEEERDLEASWKCTECKVPRSNRKQLSMCRSSDILIMSIKRFYVLPDGTSHKLADQVSFPVNNVDMATLCGRPAGSLGVFDLVGVVKHAGELAGGHYVTFAFNERTGEWLRYDDDVVSSVAGGASALFDRKDFTSYLFMFRKQGGPALSSAQLQSILADAEDDLELVEPASNADVTVTQPSDVTMAMDTAVVIAPQLPVVAAPTSLPPAAAPADSVLPTITVQKAPNVPLTASKKPHAPPQPKPAPPNGNKLTLPSTKKPANYSRRAFKPLPSSLVASPPSAPQDLDALAAGLSQLTLDTLQSRMLPLVINFARHAEHLTRILNAVGCIFALLGLSEDSDVENSALGLLEEEGGQDLLARLAVTPILDWVASTDATTREQVHRLLLPLKAFEALDRLRALRLVLLGTVNFGDGGATALPEGVDIYTRVFVESLNGWTRLRILIGEDAMRTPAAEQAHQAALGLLTAVKQAAFARAMSYQPGSGLKPFDLFGALLLAVDQPSAKHEALSAAGVYRNLANAFEKDQMMRIQELVDTAARSVRYSDRPERRPALTDAASYHEALLISFEAVALLVESLAPLITTRLFGSLDLELLSAFLRIYEPAWQPPRRAPVAFSEPDFLDIFAKKPPPRPKKTKSTANTDQAAATSGASQTAKASTGTGSTRGRGSGTGSGRGRGQGRGRGRGRGRGGQSSGAVTRKDRDSDDSDDFVGSPTKKAKSSDQTKQGDQTRQPRRSARSSGVRTYVASDSSDEDNNMAISQSVAPANSTHVSTSTATSALVTPTQSAPPVEQPKEEYNCQKEGCTWPDSKELMVGCDDCEEDAVAWYHRSCAGVSDETTIMRCPAHQALADSLAAASKQSSPTATAAAGDKIGRGGEADDEPQ